MKDTAEAVKGVLEAVPIYEDALQPLAKETGKALSTLGRAVNAALLPLKLVVWGSEQLERFLTEDVADRLKNVPPERIVTPDPRVLVPIIDAVRLIGHNPDLRALYANLLSGAMNSDTATGVHPAFVEILRQITSDEARIIRLFVNGQKFPVWHLDANILGVEVGAPPKEILTRLEYMSLIGYDADCEDTDRVPSYINNLCRLGLAYLTSKQMPHEFRDEARFKSIHQDYSDPRLEELIEKTPQVYTVFRQVTTLGHPSNYITIWTRYMTVTPFGNQFCWACVMPPEHSEGKVL